MFRLFPEEINERLMPLPPKDKLVKIAEDFYQKLDIPFPEIDDLNKEVMVTREIFDYFSQHEESPTLKINISTFFSARRCCSVAILDIGNGLAGCIVDPRTKKVIRYMGSDEVHKKEIKEMIEEYKKGEERPISEEEAYGLANRYLDIIGRSPDVEDAYLYPSPFKRLDSKEEIYIFHFPKVLNDYKYHPAQSGIFIAIGEKGGLLMYGKHFWGQRRCLLTPRISLVKKRHSK